MGAFFSSEAYGSSRFSSPERIFPSDAGIIDVTAPPYNAIGDGVTDCTKAIQRALDDHPSQGAIIYLPAGVYVVSDTLRWPDAPEDRLQRFTTLQGQSRGKATLRVLPRSANFSDRHNPRPVIWTGVAPAQRFRNQIHDLTIEIGEGNVGAIGMQFMANNQGGIYNVDIVSIDREALIGIDMSYSDEIGPLLIKGVRIFGFSIGIALRYWVDGVVMEYVHLERQTERGLINDGQCLSIRGLSSVNEVIAVENRYGASLLTLVDSTFAGIGASTATRPAILNEAGLFTRALSISGYTVAIEDREGRRRISPAEAHEEYTSHEAKRLFPGVAASLNLPIKDTPDVPWGSPQEWVSPTHFGYQPGSGKNAAPAIQEAIDSGATTIYLPRGMYRIDSTVVLRGNVRRVIGCEAFIDFPSDFGPAFLVSDGRAPVIVFERIGGIQGHRCWIESRTSRTIIVKHTSDICQMHYGPGEVYLEDNVANCFTPFEFHGKNVWARQFNVEQREVTHCLNDGGTLWILGLKVENGGTRIHTRNGGATEILGGFIYSQAADNSAPAFLNEDSRMSVTIGEACFGGRPITTLVEEIRDGESRRLPHRSVPARGQGSLLVLYSGGK